MPDKNEEMKLLAVAIGVVFFSILAIVLFLVNVQVAFYASAVIAIVLGFYLSRTLSKSGSAQKQERKRGK